MTIGERIKAARKNAGMTQKDLAEKLGIPYQGISQYERGIRKPKIDALVRISNALGVTLEDITPIQETEGYLLPVDPGMVSTLDWHARQNHRTLKEEVDIAIDSYLNAICSMGELDEEYYKTGKEQERPFRGEWIDHYFELEPYLDSLNQVGFEKVLSFVRDLVKIPEYQAKYKANQSDEKEE